jgi:hypothetical protein
MMTVPSRSTLVTIFSLAGGIVTKQTTEPPHTELRVESPTTKRVAFGLLFAVALVTGLFDLLDCSSRPEPWYFSHSAWGAPELSL